MPKTQRQQLKHDIDTFLDLPVTAGPIELSLHKAVVAVLYCGGINESVCATLQSTAMTSDDYGATFEYKIGGKQKRFSIPVGTPAYDAVHNYVSVRTGFKSPYFFLECDATKCFLRDRRMPVKAVHMILQRMAVTVGTNPAGYRLSDLRMMSMTRRPY